MKTRAAMVVAVALLLTNCGGGSADNQDTPGGGIVTAAAPTAPRSATTASTATAAVSPAATTISQASATAVSASATAPPSAAGSGATAAPTLPPVPTATSAPPRAATANVTVHAANLAFDTQTVRVPAGARVTATLVNDDSGIEHNLSFGVPGLPHGETCKGPCSKTQVFTAPATAGSFFFLCTLHDMFGTFIVE